MAEKNVDKVQGEQFPSEHGAEQVEIAERTQDTNEQKAERYIKLFVVKIKDLADWAQMHEANFLAVLQEAIQRGLHPKGEPSFDGAEDHPDGVSHTLTYSVDVCPAHVDNHNHDTVTPSIH